MAGRRPKPTAIRELEGNRGKRPLNQGEPKPKGIPTCPSHLDADAKREWKRIGPELMRLGLLTAVDRAALAAYCAAYSRWAAAERNVQKFGVVIKAPRTGTPMHNPYVQVANTSLDQMRKFAIEFGLTPASRSRIQADPLPSDEDPFESFMRGIGADDITETHDDPTEQTGAIHSGCDIGEASCKQASSATG
jgi:P27 family predicted phage terminase small subunit